MNRLETRLLLGILSALPVGVGGLAHDPSVEARS